MLLLDGLKGSYFTFNSYFLKKKKKNIILNILPYKKTFFKCKYILLHYLKMF